MKSGPLRVLSSLARKENGMAKEHIAGVKILPPPFEFTGTIFKVTADVSGKMIQDTEEEMKAMAKAHMARQ